MGENQTDGYRFMMSSERIPLTGTEYDTEEEGNDFFVINFDEIKKSGSYVWVIIVLVVVIVLGCIGRFLYRRHKLKRALLANENSGALEMRYSEYSVN